MRIIITAIFFFMLLSLPLFGGDALPPPSQEPRDYDFGTLGGDETPVHIFKFKNDAAGAIRVLQIRVPCGCALTEIGKKEIGAGETVDFRVQFKPGGRTGKITKHIYVVTDSAEESVCRFTLSANVLPGEGAAGASSPGDRPDGNRAVPASAGVPLFYFYEKDCPETCKEVEELVLPELSRIYGGRLRIVRMDVGLTENFGALLDFEREYGIPASEMPVFFMPGGTVGKGAKTAGRLKALAAREIDSKTPGRHKAFLDKYMAGKKERGSGTGPNPPAVPAPGNRKTAGKFAAYYFTRKGCPACRRSNLDARYLAGKFASAARVETLFIENPGAKILNEALCRKFDVPEKRHLVAPSIFFGKTAIVGEADFKKMKVAERFSASLAAGDITPEISSGELDAAKDAICSRFSGMAWTGVLLAGLLDGINPCAFVTIIFLLSYLSLLEYDRRSIALTGIGFTAAVFLTYLLIGLGLFKFVEGIRSIPQLADTVYYCSVMLVLAVGLANLYDYFRIRRGGLGNMKFKLAGGLRKKINETIRRRVRLGHIVAGAFVIGATVSVLELACTGQVYLPTILFITETRGVGLRAFSMLAGYNVAFIVPLVAVFGLFMAGVTGGRLSAWLERRGADIKLATAALFILLGAALVFMRG